jgi:hypothetical protein
MVLVVASVSGQQFRDPAMPSNASPGFDPHLSLQARLHADAIRRQMIRAQREQGAPEGFAENAYRAQQFYAAQQAQAYLQAEPTHLDSAHGVSQVVHQDAQYAARPAPLADNPAPLSSRPPVHLTPPRAGLGVSTVTNPVPMQASQPYSRSRPQSPVTPLNDRTLHQPTGNQTTTVPDPKFPASMQPRQPKVRLQERISRAISGGRHSLPRTDRNANANYGVTHSQYSQTRIGSDRVPNSQAFVDSHQQQQVRRGTAQPMADSKRQRMAKTPASSKMASRRQPPRRAIRSRVTRDSQVTKAVERVTSSTRQPEPAAVKQTVMQEPIVETYSDPVDSLPQFVDEPEVFVAQEQGNSLRKSVPKGRQISILNRSNASGEDNYDLPAEPEFVQDGNDFSEVGNGSDLQLSRPIGPADGQTAENDLRRQGDSDSSLRSLLDDAEANDDREAGENLLEKSCDEFRRELLENPIRNIALDISPPASELLEPDDAISRDWTDRLGNVVATGRMVDLRRGYVILDSTNGRIKLAIARLSDADLDAVADYWQIPVTCGVGIRGSVDRCWAPQTFTWTAPSLCHKTLYFENVQLERYGHSHGPFTQPIRSVGHFFVSLISIPYQTAIHPPNECNYALGFYRPGDCAPWLKDPVPISLRGALRQAGVVVGLGYGL